VCVCVCVMAGCHHDRRAEPGRASPVRATRGVRQFGRRTDGVRCTYS